MPSIFISFFEKMDFSNQYQNITKILTKRLTVFIGFPDFSWHSKQTLILTQPKTLKNTFITSNAPKTVGILGKLGTYNYPEIPSIKSDIC